MKELKCFLILTVAVLFSLSSVWAQSISFNLDIANCNLADPGVNGYATVTLEKDGDCVIITVTPNMDFFNEGTNFGIQAFSFNCIGDFDEEDFIVPNGWSIDLEPKTRSQFGVFIDNFDGSGNSRKNPLVIKVCSNSVPDLDLENFLLVSTGNNGGYLFAAHIAAFNNPITGCSSGCSCWFSAVPKLITFAEEIDFSASVENRAVKLQWTAISEENVLGYKILRANGLGNNYIQVDDMIYAKGSIETTVDYEYIDATIKNRQFVSYKLLEIGTAGAVREHGPVFVIIK